MKPILLPSLVAGTLLAGCASHPAAHPQAETEYQRPLFSIGQKFGGLPPAVQNTVRAEAGAAEVGDVNRETTPSGEPVYVITFRKSTVYQPLYVAADGSVLNRDYTLALSSSAGNIGVVTSGPQASLRMSDLPQEVIKRIQQQAPNAEIAHIGREATKDRVVYTIDFKDEAKNPRMHIGSDGTVLAEPPK
jgi:hypothetical protein